MFPWKIVIFHSYVSLPEGIEGYNQIQRKKSCPPWLSIRGWEIPNSTEGRTKNLRITKGCWLDSCSIDLASSFPPRPDGWWSPHRFQDIPTGSWPPDISCRDSSAERLSKFQGGWDGPNYCCDQRRLDAWDQTWTEPMDFEVWPKSKELQLDGTFWPSLPLFPSKQAHPSSLITLWFCFANSLVGPQTRWLKTKIPTGSNGDACFLKI